MDFFNDMIVRVGEVEHTMVEEHYIMFIAQVVDNKMNLIKLNPSDKPEATFSSVKGSKIYAYCNLHGLWMNEVK